MTPLEDRLRQIIEPEVERLGFELVRLSLGGDKRRKLQIMAERPDGSMNLDDCAAISRAISGKLDETDPIPEEYVLEVSSPGIDRPLTRAKDFERWAGFMARIELSEGARRRFTGRLLGLADGHVTIAAETGEERFPLALIHKARLIITDDLLAAHQPAA